VKGFGVFAAAFLKVLRGKFNKNCHGPYK